jgi:NAD(P)-dependent dehydrogenase (short-subunit alcohol dehydrogenase family)
MNMRGANQVAQKIGGMALKCDVSKSEDIVKCIQKSNEAYGPIDIYFSNAGIGIGDDPHWTAYGHSDESWEKGISVNLMSHIYGARAVVPQMLKKGQGAFIITASAAGLLTQIGDTVYSVTKYASVGYADSLAITHGDEGLQVGLICPEGVTTPLTEKIKGGAQDFGGVKSPEDAARSILDGVEGGKYFITTHENTETYHRDKAGNYDRWVGGMKKFRRNIIEENGGVPFIIKDANKDD